MLCRALRGRAGRTTLARICSRLGKEGEGRLLGVSMLCATQCPQGGPATQEKPLARLNGMEAAHSQFFSF